MVSSSNVVSTTAEHDSPARHSYFASRGEMIDAFVARHFTWSGTVRLHRSALGWDILRAPCNVLLSPVLVLTRVSGYLCRSAGWRGGVDWLAARRILLRTSVARRVELLIVTDLLELPLDKPAAARDPSALARAALAEYAGIHRRRLHRLLDTLEVELVGRGDKPFVAREHFFARFLDIWDAAASAVRMFRN